MPTPISTGAEWSFELLARYDEAIGRIAREEFGLDCYANQIEVIDSRQMLDAYASTGLPVGYPHWSFGKSFIAHEHAYRKGARGLAYEIVINSDPCIAYLMEENPMPLQALVIAHACYGHNSFFKGNYLFRQWTAADAIVDYMVFARRYVMDCEERHGAAAVEEVLDACHALMNHGVDRYRHPRTLSADAERARGRERDAWSQQRHDEIWRTLPPRAAKPGQSSEGRRRDEPHENLLYFVEKHSPRLAQWERELVRIVRKVAQYFYPQGLTKVMNEGWATFWHYTLLNRLYDHGLADDGFMIEFLESHTNVVAQRAFDEPGYAGCNPYALGFAMFSDIRRICEQPTDEDRQWFPEIAGTDWRGALDFAMRNFKDESFVAQFLSPRLIREFRLFAIADQEGDPMLEVACIHNDAGYRRVRKLLASHYDRDARLPDIQVTGFERDGDRSLTLRHVRHRGRPLDDDAGRVLAHLQRLWGFTVRMQTVDPDGAPCAETMIAD